MPEMDYSRLFGRIAEKGFSQKSLAAAIGISEGQMSLKLTGKYAFKQSDIRKICEELDIGAELIGEYFFTPKVEKSQLSDEKGA